VVFRIQDQGNSLDLGLLLGSLDFRGFPDLGFVGAFVGSWIIRWFSKVLDVGSLDLDCFGFSFWIWIVSVFQDLDHFGFSGSGFLSLLIQRCKKQVPERNFFDGGSFLPDERRICPTKES